MRFFAHASPLTINQRRSILFCASAAIAVVAAVLAPQFVANWHQEQASEARQEQERKPAVVSVFSLRVDRDRDNLSAPANGGQPINFRSPRPERAVLDRLAPIAVTAVDGAFSDGSDLDKAVANEVAKQVCGRLVQWDFELMPPSFRAELSLTVGGGKGAGAAERLSTVMSRHRSEFPHADAIAACMKLAGHAF